MDDLPVHGIEREIWAGCGLYGSSATVFIPLSGAADTGYLFRSWTRYTIPEKVEIIRQIANAGHEIANHSYSHSIPFTRLDEKTIEEEISKTQIELEKLTGLRPKRVSCTGVWAGKRVMQILDNINLIMMPLYFPRIGPRCYRKLKRKKAGLIHHLEITAGINLEVRRSNLITQTGNIWIKKGIHEFGRFP